MPEISGSQYMDHEQSIGTRAAESYLLGELSPTVREAFEQHFFECEECAQEVRLGFEFSQNLKAVLHDEARAARPLGKAKRLLWFSSKRFASKRVAPMWAASKVPLAACLAIAAFSGYQNAVQIPSLRART